MTLHVLFVCTGNICRSPTAERLAAAYAAAQAIPKFTATSAGTRAMIGHSIHPDAAQTLHGLGGDPAGFAARQLSAKIASAADLILAMTRTHRDAVLELAPHRLNRTFTLAEASRLVTELDAQSLAELAMLRPRLAKNLTMDIEDPIGQSPKVFETIGVQIAGLLPPVLELCRPR